MKNLFNMCAIKVRLPLDLITLFLVAHELIILVSVYMKLSYLSNMSKISEP